LGQTFTNLNLPSKNHPCPNPPMREGGNVCRKKSIRTEIQKGGGEGHTLLLRGERFAPGKVPLSPREGVPNQGGKEGDDSGRLPAGGSGRLGKVPYEPKLNEGRSLDPCLGGKTFWGGSFCLWEKKRVANLPRGRVTLKGGGKVFGPYFSRGESEI